MGWAGATSLFDGAVDVTLKFMPWSGSDGPPGIMVKAVVEAMYTQVNWDDWDTQDESEYFEDYLVHIMHELGELDDEYYESFAS